MARGGRYLWTCTSPAPHLPSFYWFVRWRSFQSGLSIRWLDWWHTPGLGRTRIASSWDRSWSWLCRQPPGFRSGYSWRCQGQLQLNGLSHVCGISWGMPFSNCLDVCDSWISVDTYCGSGRELQRSISTILGTGYGCAHPASGYRHTGMENIWKNNWRGCPRFPHHTLIPERVHWRSKTVPHQEIPQPISAPLGRPRPLLRYIHCREHFTSQSCYSINFELPPTLNTVWRCSMDRLAFLLDSNYYSMAGGYLWICHCLFTTWCHNLVDWVDD